MVKTQKEKDRIKQKKKNWANPEINNVCDLCDKTLNKLRKTKKDDTGTFHTQDGTIICKKCDVKLNKELERLKEYSKRSNIIKRWKIAHLVEISCPNCEEAFVVELKDGKIV